MLLRGHRYMPDAGWLLGALAAVRPLQVLAARRLRGPPYHSPQRYTGQVPFRLKATENPCWTWHGLPSLCCVILPTVVR